MEEEKYNAVNLLKKNKIFAKKYLGQNFLANSLICEKIIEKMNLNNKVIIEIGAGLGALTHLLAINNKVIAIEIDTKLCQIVEEVAKSQNLVIINDDFLKIDLNNFITKYDLANKKVVIVSNLPYYITTPIIERLLVSNLNIENMFLMMQKEVSFKFLENFNNKSCDGILATLLLASCHVEKFLEVDKNNFHPTPPINSTILKIEVLDNAIDNKINFLKFLEIIFSNRRKTLVNNLQKYNINKETIKDKLVSLEINETIRCEELNIEQIKKLYYWVKSPYDKLN